MIKTKDNNRSWYKLTENHILVEAEKIYFIDELLESKGE